MPPEKGRSLQRLNLNPSEPEHRSGLSPEVEAVAKSFKSAYRSHDRRKGRQTHRLNGEELSQAQFELLVELMRQGPLAVGALADSMGLSAASVSQMVDRLTDQGHVTRSRSESDRRVVELELSDQGRAALDPIIERWRAAWTAALEDLPESDLEAAARVLGRITDLYDADDRVTQPGRRS